MAADSGSPVRKRRDLEDADDRRSNNSCPVRGLSLSSKPRPAPSAPPYRSRPTDPALKSTPSSAPQSERKGRGLLQDPPLPASPTTCGSEEAERCSKSLGWLGSLSRHSSAVVLSVAQTERPPTVFSLKSKHFRRLPSTDSLVNSLWTAAS